MLIKIIICPKFFGDIFTYVFLFYRGNVKDNDYSVVPKLRDNFHDVFAELEKELAKDPNMAFSESADSPIDEVYDTLGTI